MLARSSASPSHRRLRPLRGKILASFSVYTPCKINAPPEAQEAVGRGQELSAVRHEPTNPDDGLARAGAADRQGVPLLGGEQPVGCALLSRKSQRQRIAAPLFFGLGLRDTADKTSDSRACRDAHPRWFPSSPSWSLSQKITNLPRTRSLVMATVPGGGGDPRIVA